VLQGKRGYPEPVSRLQQAKSRFAGGPGSEIVASSALPTASASDAGAAVAAREQRVDGSPANAFGVSETALRGARKNLRPAGMVRVLRPA
jgi:hypothetical protein